MSNIDKQALREEFRYMQDHYSDPADRERQEIYIAAEALLDELEHYKSREERVTKLVLDNSTSWDALYKKLEASGKRIAELVNDEVRQRLANAEHQLHMAELAKCNLRASRKAQFRKRKAAERRIAELEAKLETADKLQDSAFRDGLKTGFSYGQTDDQSGYEQCLKSYSSRGKDNG
ncbi:Ead protein [Salmonella enterica subsp. salamae]|nr:Ead protein [Salmonella enterica subsp. salamae]